MQHLRAAGLALWPSAGEQVFQGVTMAEPALNKRRAGAPRDNSALPVA
jgi:hypothetical protein